MKSHVAKFIKRNSLALLDRQKLIALKPRPEPKSPKPKPPKAPRAQQHEDILVHFLSHVDQCERLDLCWNWKWSRAYGRFNGWLAHRWIYSLLFGEIPAGHVIHHTCLNSRCVNPVHLKCVDKALHASMHNSLNGAESVKLWLDFNRSNEQVVRCGAPGAPKHSFICCG